MLLGSKSMHEQGLELMPMFFVQRTLMAPWSRSRGCTKPLGWASCLGHARMHAADALLHRTLRSCKPC